MEQQRHPFRSKEELLAWVRREMAQIKRESVTSWDDLEKLFGRIREEDETFTRLCSEPDVAANLRAVGVTERELGKLRRLLIISGLSAAAPFILADLENFQKLVQFHRDGARPDIVRKWFLAQLVGQQRHDDTTTSQAAAAFGEQVIPCPKCGQRNRMRRMAAGVVVGYRCGACKADLPNPFVENHPNPTPPEMKAGKPLNQDGLKRLLAQAVAKSYQQEWQEASHEEARQMFLKSLNEDLHLYGLDASQVEAAHLDEKGATNVAALFREAPAMDLLMRWEPEAVQQWAESQERDPEWVRLHLWQWRLSDLPGHDG